MITGRTVKNKGDETENLIEEVSSTMFLKDFVVRNPKFKKQNGQEKEITDILIPFEDSIISIQAKSKVIDIDKASTDVIRKRISSVIDEGIGQLRNTRRIIDEAKTIYLKNVHGIQVPLRAKDVKKLHGIVIAKLYGAGRQLNVPSGFQYTHDMPIHVLSADDFEMMARELSTIPDFLNYLDVRTRLFRESKLKSVIRELDLLAMYKTQPEVVRNVMDQDGATLIVEEGIWGQYISERQKDIQERDRLNVPSYLIDVAIEQFSQSIGYAPDILNPITGKNVEPGTVENYWKTVYELSKLTRLDRRLFGSKMLEKARQADTEVAEGYTMAIYEEGEAILFYSLQGNNRRVRAERLYKLASLAYIQNNLKKIIAIASEPLSDSGRSFDLILLEDVKFQNTQEILKTAPRMFSEPLQLEGYEYTEELD